MLVTAGNKQDCEEESSAARPDLGDLTEEGVVGLDERDLVGVRGDADGGNDRELVSRAGASVESLSPEGGTSRTRSCSGGSCCSGNLVNGIKCFLKNGGGCARFGGQVGKLWKVCCPL